MFEVVNIWILKEATWKQKGCFQENFGNYLLIPAACLEKAVGWNAIKTEDRRGLNDYALFLKGCCNTMQDVEFVEEMNNPSNMKKSGVKTTL